MKIFVNVESRQLQTAVGDSRQVSTLAFKRGDGASVEIIFVRDGVQVELTSGSIVTFGAKLSGKYDANALVLENGFALSGSGSTASYIGAPSFNTVDLDAALEKDGDDTNDVPYLDLMGEISWTDGPTGEPTSTDTFTVRVNNDVLRGDEVGPVDITEGTPTNGVKATKAAAVDTNPSNGQTLIISNGTTTTTYTLKTSPTLANDIQIGATEPDTAANIAAITNALVDITNTFSDLTITAKEYGAAGNDIQISGTFSGLVLTGGANLSGGVDYTPGRVGSMKVDEFYLYVAYDFTDGIPLWKKIELTAL